MKFLEDVKRGQEVVAEEDTKAEPNEAAPAAEASEEAAPKAEEDKAEEVDTPEAEGEEEKTADHKAVESEDVEPKPIGTGVFGNIFNQFKGKVKEAFDFLMKHKSGDLLGVFHRDEVGDIDLVWGDEKKGLKHIIDNHIEVKDPDFANINEAMQRIEDIINSGMVVKEGAAKIVFEKDGYRVVISKNINGEQKNWVLTSYDSTNGKGKKKEKLTDDTTLITPDSNEGSRAVTPSDSSSTDKVTESAATAQTEGKENEAKEGYPYYWSKGYFDSLTDEQKRKFDDLAKSLGGHIDWENNSLTMPSEEAAEKMFDDMDKERDAASDSNTTEKHSERAEDAAEETKAESEAQPTDDGQKPSEAKPKQPADPDANLRADIRAARDLAKMMFPDVNPELLDKIARDLNQQPLTRKQREQMERIAKAFGLRIRWFKTMPQNGTFSREKGVICIATDSWHQLSDTFGHEMTHALKNVDMNAYNRLKQAVIEANTKNEAERKGLQKAIDQKYSGYDAKDRMEEYVSDKIGAAIASNDMANAILFNLDHKVLGRMRDIVKRMRAAVSDFSFNTENKVRGLLHMEERERDERVPSALEKFEGAIMDAYRMAHDTEVARRAEEKRKAEEEKKKEEERKKAEEKRKKVDEGVKRSERMEESHDKEQKVSNIDSQEASFHSIIDQMFDDNNFDKSQHLRERYDLGVPPSWMKSIGITGEYFSLSFKTIKVHKGKDTDHDLTREEWHRLPDAIREPFLVTRYNNATDRFRLYVNIYHNGKPVVVGIDVKRVNQGKNMPILEVNSIKTVFAHHGEIGGTETLVTYDEKITPEQQALLRGLNFHEYPTIQELSAANVANNSDTGQTSAEENEEKGTKESRRSLVGVHNITEEKLAKALKLGGLANPSVAVVDSDKGTHDSFGEISLILPSSMVDKQTGRNAGTFIGDAYTPRFPSISKVISSKGYNKMAKAAEKLPDATMAEEMRRAFVADYLEDGREGGLEYWFLHDKGMEPKVVKKAGAMWSSDVEAVRKATDSFYAKPKDLNREQIEVLRDVAAHYGGKTRKYWDEKRKEYLDSAKDESKKEHVRDFFQRLADQIEHYGMTEREVTNLIQDANYESSNKGDTDVEATRMQAAQYVRNNGLEGEFRDWLEEKNAAYDVKDKLFQGYTYSGNRRYKDATLENISKEMKKQGLNDAEGFSGTFHSFVASVLKPVGNLDEIRERKGQLTNDKSVLDGFEKIAQVYSDLTTKLRDRDGYDWNAGYERLKEIASKRNPRKYAKDHYGDVLNEGDLDDLESMLNEIRRKPSKYFETKFERPVMLNEFASAVVPSDISEKVRKGLEDAGLKLHEYDRNKEGDRERAFNEAINERDDVKFSKRNSSSNEYTPEERSKFKGVPISKPEYAKLFHAIHTHNQFKVGEINEEYTADYYYLYTHHGDGDFTVEAQIPRDGYGDLIRDLNENLENGTIRDSRDIGSAIERDRSRQNRNYHDYASSERRPRWNVQSGEMALRHEADRRRGHEQLGEGISGRSSSEVYPADRGGRIDDEAGDVVSELVNSINTESFKDVQRILSIFESKDKLEEFWDRVVNKHLKPWDEVNKRALALLHIAIDERKAELEGNEPVEKFSLRDGSFIRSGSYFSGGGLLEEGLKNYLDPRVAVEFNEKIAGVYADNFGRHIVTADVRNVDPRELTEHVDGSVEYFHASPVCKNFSRAKREAGEVELDKETAQSTADFIRANRPRVVTIENVKGYRGSDALKIITDALTEEGYDWDADVYNTGDFGGYTKRERLIVRAVRDGKLPEKPKPLPQSERKGGWMEAVTDLMDSLPEKRSGVPEWMDKRLKAMGIDWRHIDKPLYVLGQGDAADKVSHAFADELLPTLRTKGGDVIIMPDGRVLRATPRVLARVTGLADDYKMPVTDDMAHTIVGNGIPSQLSEHVVGPLLEHMFNGGEPITRDVKESRRVSGRLANTGNTSSVAQRIYEEAVRGRAFEWDEAWHDSLVSVKALQDALAKERGVDIRDLENVYLHLVHLSSVSAAEMTEYRNKQVENLLSAMGRTARPFVTLRRGAGFLPAKTERPCIGHEFLLYLIWASISKRRKPVPFRWSVPAGWNPAPFACLSSSTPRFCISTFTLHTPWCSIHQPCRTHVSPKARLFFSKDKFRKTGT